MLNHDQIVSILIMLAYIAVASTFATVVCLLVNWKDNRDKQIAIDKARHPSARNLDDIKDPIDQAVELGNL